MRFFTLLWIILLLCGFTSMALASDKIPTSSVQLEIDHLKSQGEPVPGALWHAAELEYLTSRSTAATGLNSMRDGGSNAATATVIDTSDYQDSGTTVGKGNNASIPSCNGGNDTAPDAWYVLTVSESFVIEAWTTCASSGPPSYDTRLGIFNTQLALVACNDDDPACGNPNYQSRISGQALAAGTYYIVVDGYSGASGPYQLNVHWNPLPPPCSNGSNQTNAEVITSLPFIDQGNTGGACNDVIIQCESSGPDTAQDYWYTVELDTTTLLTVWTSCGAQYHDSKIAILDSMLNQMYCNDDNPACPNGQSLIAQAAVTPGRYYIVVDGYHAEAGAYEINVQGVPYDSSVVDTLLPDIIIRENDLYDNEMSTTVVPGRRHLKLSNATPNLGPGKLYLYGVLPANGDGTQDVRQRVYRSDGSFFDRTAGKFIFHPGHDHIHVENWSQFRIRELLPDSGVGPIIAAGEKTSFCILDLAVYNSTLPNFDPDGQFHSCSSTIQGLSVGWVDIYSKDLPGQNIDVTDVPDGVYWLESVVDPDNTILEENENNNATRILVTIGDGSSGVADAYEPNNSFEGVDARPVGSNNSPNLGPCNPQRVISGLSIHDNNNDDYFRFYMNHSGASGDFVKITFDNALGDLDLGIYSANHLLVAASTSNSDSEFVSLAGRAEGWYYARVYGDQGAVNPLYTLTINPPANNAPSLTVTEPGAGDTTLIHGQDTYTVTWSFADPESDECWVTVYTNAIPSANGEQALLPTSLNTPAAQGFYIINSAYVPEDQPLYVMCTITDGGTTSLDWSAGTVTFVDQAHSHGMIAGTVVNSDSLPVEGAEVFLSEHPVTDTTDAQGNFQINDIEPGIYALTVTHPDFPDTTLTDVMINVAGIKSKLIVLEGCGFVAGDADGSKAVNISDAVMLINYIFGGGPAPEPQASGDADCSGTLSISDAVYLITYIFGGGLPPCGC